MDRPHLRYRVEYLKGSAVVDHYDTEDPNVTQAVIGAETFFDRAKREHGAESFRILDRVSGHYFEGPRLGLLEFAIGDIREAVWTRNITIRQLRKRVAAILERLD